MPDLKNDAVKLAGSLYKTADGRQSYEIYLATSEFIFVAAKILHEQFGFSKCHEPFVGLDEVITDCEREGIKLLLGWDIWSGIYLMAASEAGDAIVSEVGLYLNSIIQTSEFERYIHRW